MKLSPPLETRGVFFAYDRSPVLCGVTLKVQVGEMLGLVGPNGAGKTTLLRILNGTLRPQQGQVLIDGRDLSEIKPARRARMIATLSQQPAVPEGFSALDVVLMGRNPHLRLLQWEGRYDLEVARRAMEVTETLQFATREISSLSGGERQRVFIARALAQEPSILLLDEPTAHLDIGYQSATLDLISRIQEEAGITVILSVHDLTLAAQYCHRIAVLHEGRISALGEPRSVLTSEVISRVFRASVSVIDHPVQKTPVILFNRQAPGALARKERMR